MSREQALAEWSQKQEPYLQKHRQDFVAHLPEGLPRLKAQICETMAHLREQAERQSKQQIVYFQFSLLRYGIQEGKHSVYVQAQEVDWFMDPNPLTDTFDIGYLFKDLYQLWEHIQEESRPYLGKVNKYDCNRLICEEAMACYRILAAPLRFWFRDIEKNGDFAVIPKAPLWDIRWGEYRDESDLIACADRMPKDRNQWLEAVQKADKEEGLSMSYWYQLSLENQEYHKNLLFATFEECRFTKVDFSKADLTGARFLSCLFAHCNFNYSIDHYASFEQCQWDQVSFEQADMKQALFSAAELPETSLTQEQLDVILVKGEPADEAIF